MGTAVPDLSEYEAVPRRGRGPQCALGRALRELSEQDAINLQGALDTGVDAYRIVDVLAGKGHPMKADTVRRHNRGDCSCPRA